MSDLKNKFTYQLANSASQVLLPLIAYPYIARVLGPANLGKVNYVDFVAQVFMIVAAFGIPFYAIREIAIVRNDSIKRSELIKELFIIQTIFSIIAAIIYMFFIAKDFTSTPFLYTLGLANIVMIAFSFDWYMQGMEHFKFAAIRNIAVKIITLISLYVFVKKADDFNIYFGIYSAGIAAIALFNSIKLIKENNFTKTPINLQKHFTPLLHLFLTASAIGTYVYFDTIILKAIAQNETIVGYYSIAAKIARVFFVVIAALTTVMLPKVSYLVSIKKEDEVKGRINKLIEFVVCVALPISVALFILSPEIITAIAGKEYLPAISVLQILAAMPIIVGLGDMFCYQVLVPFKKEKNFLLVAITGCITSLLLNFILIKLYGMHGAALATITVELIVAIIAGLYAYKMVKFSIESKLLISCLVCSLLFIPIIYLLRLATDNAILILALSILTCSSSYFIAQTLAFKNEMLNEIKQYLLSIFKRGSSF